MPDIVFMTDGSRIDGVMDAYLLLDIIPEKGTHSYINATHVCTTCARKFPRQEFSNTQLRNGDQKCRVCKEIKRREDVHSNWAANEERNWSGWRSRRYHDYLDDDCVQNCGNYCCDQNECRCTETMIETVYNDIRHIQTKIKCTSQKRHRLNALILPAWCKFVKKFASSLLALSQCFKCLRKSDLKQLASSLWIKSL